MDFSPSAQYCVFAHCAARGCQVTVREFVPDPLEFWEYASEEEIQAAIESDRADYEKYCEERDRKVLND